MSADEVWPLVFDVGKQDFFIPTCEIGVFKMSFFIENPVFKMSHFSIQEVIDEYYESRKSSDILNVQEMFNKSISIDKSCLNSKMHLR